MIRNVGPCWRCSVVYLNWEKCCKVEDGGAFSTLASYRSIPGKGVAFGMYYQMEILDKPAYESFIPSEQGYPKMTESLIANPMIQD